MATLTTVLHSCGHEASEWTQLCQQHPEFATTYQLLGIGTSVTNFHIQDRLLCHLGHLYVPTSEHAKLIWEAHYSWMAGHFGVEKIVVVLQKHFYWPKLRQDVSKYIRSCTACAIAKPVKFGSIDSHSPMRGHMGHSEASQGDLENQPVL
jgi:hypothetical protein